MLKVGELAARAGMTVRTLHHYDSIGLLIPSARSDAGYRLYDRNDVARLHQIQALRKFGMALADIGAYLDSPDASPIAIVARQIALLDRQIGEAARMRDTLANVHAQLSKGEVPELATWLTTLEQMTMYEKYFSKEELKQLPIYQNKDAEAEWKRLVSQVDDLMAAGVPVADEAARQLARNWMALLERDTAGNQALLAQLNSMHENEPSVQRDTGISMQLKGYIMRAIAEVKFDVYAKYLTPEEIGHMRRHQQTRVREWPALIENVRAQMRTDPSPDSPRARELAAQWFDLFQDMVGSDPATVARFRTAVESEPVLRMGRGMTDEMIVYLRRARDRT
ncbi:MAG: MerR family transcriptional regulator [Collimonas fungivorans]|nr:MerR family transcriptional regulator [Collimonas fungivorans]